MRYTGMQDVLFVIAKYIYEYENKIQTFFKEGI